MMRPKSQNRHLPHYLLSYGTVTQDMYDDRPIDVSGVYNVIGILWYAIYLEYMQHYIIQFFFPCTSHILFSRCNGWLGDFVCKQRVCYECLVAVTSSTLTVLVSHLLPIFPFLFSTIVTAIIIIIIIIVTYTHGIYSDIPKTKHVSRVYIFFSSCNIIYQDQCFVLWHLYSPK
jgi:hypothetical protein